MIRTLMIFIPGLQKKTVFLFTLLILFIMFCPSYAEKVKQSIDAKKLVPSCLLDWKSGPEFSVLVDKSRQKVMIYRRDNLYSPYKVYDCSTGENKGSKQRKNDRKTPEGIYFFIKSYEDKYLSPVYGTRALPLNYPNEIDQKKGKTGYGIWFHGTNKVLKPRDTNGCIALDNRDIEELAGIVSLFDTPVIICSQIDLVPEGQLDELKMNLSGIVNEWEISWEDEDIDRYMSYYSKKFESGWRDWGKWKDYKKRLAKKYKNISVEVNDLNLFYHDGVVLASFEQSYQTPSFDSYGDKNLYLTQNSTEWKIIAETFREKAKPKFVKKKVPEFNTKEIKDFLFSWKDAWENKDLTNYILCYDKNFKSRGMGLNSWKQHRDKLNEKYDTIKVEIEKIEIKPFSSGSRAKISFIQKYEADEYSDKGKKEILLVRKGEDWKIRKEDWTPIQ